jgi:O-antigen/teichoic acid export membrane protein
MSVVLTFLVNTIFNLIVGLIVAKFLGPEEYGKFALAIGVMTFGQALAFEWIRQCAVRFYSERTQAEAPKVRATLDAAFAGFSLLFFPLAAAAAFLGPEFSLPREMVGLAFAASIANGLFDYQTALVRARFADRLYLKLVVTKNLFAVVFTAGGAWATGSAKIALLAGMGSLMFSVFIWRRKLTDSDARLTVADKKLARVYAAYAAPIVVSIMLYQLIPLINRDLAARFYGFAETGRFALAYDLGLRAVAALGSALDVLLFQIAVRAHDKQGEDEAKAQVAQNIGVVFAILVPACVGVWIVLPSVEVLVVPQAYRGAFSHYLTLMLPGLVCVGIGQFSLNAIFQIARKTWPLTVSALIVCIADPLFFWLLRDEGVSGLAKAQSLAFAAGLASLILFAMASRPQWPRLRDLALTLVAAGGMAALAAPLRSLEPGLPLMLTQIVLAGSFYLLIVAVFDLAGLRRAFLVKAAPAARWLHGRHDIFKTLLPLSIE